MGDWCLNLGNAHWSFAFFKWFSGSGAERHGVDASGAASGLRHFAELAEPFLTDGQHRAWVEGAQGLASALELCVLCFESRSRLGELLFEIGGHFVLSTSRNRGAGVESDAPEAGCLFRSEKSRRPIEREAEGARRWSGGTHESPRVRTGRRGFVADGCGECFVKSRRVAPCAVWSHAARHQRQLQRRWAMN